MAERYHFDPWGNRKNPINWGTADTRTDFLFDRGFAGHERLDVFKIINMNARLYDPVLGRFFSPDPYVQTPESAQGFNRYSYCANNPLTYTDPSGELISPIFDYFGIFLGTDDLGIQGEAIIMKKKDFRQNMSHDEALRLGTLRSQLPMMIHPDILSKIDNQIASFPSRPDWDGYLTLAEANDWYRNGNGQSLYVDASKIDLSPVKVGDFSGVGSSMYKNFAFTKNTKTGLVYGNIKLTLLNDEGDIMLGGVGGFLDRYDFDYKSGVGNIPRNIATWIGARKAGKGIGYDIFNYGTGKIK